MQDIYLPQQMQEPPIQSVSHTAFGRVIKPKYEEAPPARGDVLSEEVFTELAVKFKVIAQQKGIQL